MARPEFPVLGVWSLEDAEEAFSTTPHSPWLDTRNQFLFRTAEAIMSGVTGTGSHPKLMPSRHRYAEAYRRWLEDGTLPTGNIKVPETLRVYQCTVMGRTRFTVRFGGRAEPEGYEPVGEFDLVKEGETSLRDVAQSEVIAAALVGSVLGASR